MLAAQNFVAQKNRVKILVHVLGAFTLNLLQKEHEPRHELLLPQHFC